MTGRFVGTQRYIATPDLEMAVNAAVTLQRPLLVKGEPGTGKTELARQVAASLGMGLIEWGIKSTTKAQQGLYEYDAVARLRDSHLPMGLGGERDVARHPDAEARENPRVAAEHLAGCIKAPTLIQLADRTNRTRRIIDQHGHI